MTTIIVNNGPTSAKPSTPKPKTPGPKSIQKQSLKQTIRNIAKTFLSHYDEGTADEFLRSQKYTDAELILFCKAAKIPYSGKNKEEKLDSICAFLNKNRRGVMDFIEIVGASGQLMIAGIGAIVAVSGLLLRYKNQFNLMSKLSDNPVNPSATNEQDSTAAAGSMLTSLIIMVFVACLCWFVAKYSNDQEEYKKSVKDVKQTWANFKKTHKNAKRKRTSSVRRLGHTAKHVHVARTRVKLSKAKKQLHSCNSLLSKIKRGLFGGPTQVDLQQEVERLTKTLEVNH